MLIHTVAVYQIVSPVCDDTQRLNWPDGRYMKHSPEIALNGFHVMKRHTRNNILCHRAELGKLHLAGRLLLFLAYLSKR